MSSKKKTVKPLSKFFVIVPETVQFGSDRTSHKMEAGRLMAQAAHVARKIERARCKFELLSNPNNLAKYEEITTITLSVRNSKELDKVYADLKSADLNFWIDSFEDTNPGLYGKQKVRTVIMFGPTTSEQVDHLTGHLPLVEDKLFYE